MFGRIKRAREKRAAKERERANRKFTIFGYSTPIPSRYLSNWKTILLSILVITTIVRLTLPRNSNRTALPNSRERLPGLPDPADRPASFNNTTTQANAFAGSLVTHHGVALSQPPAIETDILFHLSKMMSFGLPTAEAAQTIVHESHKPLRKRDARFLDLKEMERMKAWAAEYMRRNLKNGIMDVEFIEEMHEAALKKGILSPLFYVGPRGNFLSEAIEQGRDSVTLDRFVEFESELLIQKINDKNQTCLHVAAINNCRRIFDLADAVEIDFLERDANGKSPLDLAVANGSRDVLQAYLKKSWYREEIVKSAGDHTLAAVQNQNGGLRTLVLFKEQGISLDTPIKIEKENITTSVYLMLNPQETDSTLTMLENLFSCGANTNIRFSLSPARCKALGLSAEDGHASLSLVHLAILRGWNRAVEVLLTAGAKIEDSLQFAFEKAESTTLLDIYRRCGWDVNASIGKEENKAFHFLVKAKVDGQRISAMIESLCKRGANPNALNKAGKTALNLAVESGNIILIRALLDAPKIQVTEYDVATAVDKKLLTSLIKDLQKRQHSQIFAVKPLKKEDTNEIRWQATLGAIAVATMGALALYVKPIIKRAVNTVVASQCGLKPLKEYLADRELRHLKAKLEQDKSTIIAAFAEIVELEGEVDASDKSITLRLESWGENKRAYNLKVLNYVRSKLASQIKHYYKKIEISKLKSSNEYGIHLLVINAVELEAISLNFSDFKSTVTSIKEDDFFDESFAEEPSSFSSSQLAHEKETKSQKINLLSSGIFSYSSNTKHALVRQRTKQEEREAEKRKQREAQEEANRLKENAESKRSETFRAPASSPLPTVSETKEKKGTQKVALAGLSRDVSRSDIKPEQKSPALDKKDDKASPQETSHQEQLAKMRHLPTAAELTDQECAVAIYVHLEAIREILEHCCADAKEVFQRHYSLLHHIIRLAIFREDYLRRLRECKDIEKIAPVQNKLWGDEGRNLANLKNNLMHRGWITRASAIVDFAKGLLTKLPRELYFLNITVEDGKGKGTIRRLQTSAFVLPDATRKEIENTYKNVLFESEHKTEQTDLYAETQPGYPGDKATHKKRVFHQLIPCINATPKESNALISLIAQVGEFKFEGEDELNLFISECKEVRNEVSHHKFEVKPRIVEKLEKLKARALEINDAVWDFKSNSDPFAIDKKKAGVANVVQEKVEATMKIAESEVEVVPQIRPVPAWPKRPTAKDDLAPRVGPRQPTVFDRFSLKAKAILAQADPRTLVANPHAAAPSPMR